MKRFALAIVALVLCVTFADAAAPAQVKVKVNTRRNFPVARAVGRVVTAPARAVAKVFTPRARNQVVVKTNAARVRVNSGRAAVVVNTPRVIRVNQVKVVDQVRVQQVVLRNRADYGHVNQIRVERFAAYPTQSVVVGQLGTEAYKAPEVVETEPVTTEKVILREVATVPKVQKVILRQETTGYCGGVSQLRIQRIRGGY